MSLDKKLLGYITFHLIQVLRTLKKKAFENIVGIRENADSQHFVLFPQCFIFHLRQIH